MRFKSYSYPVVGFDDPVGIGFIRNVSRLRGNPSDGLKVGGLRMRKDASVSCGHRHMHFPFPDHIDKSSGIDEDVVVALFCRRAWEFHP
jgi:hypothetical protein